MDVSLGNEEIKVLALVRSLRGQRDWVQEVDTLASLLEQLDTMNKSVSVRELSKLLEKSKSWVGMSMVLIKGIRIYPEIRRISNRHQAYIFLQRKNYLSRLT